MSFRLRPPDIEIPPCGCEEAGPKNCDCTFVHDELDRKKRISVLTHILSEIEGPCVVAVDGEWGTGKTTFLKLWAQHLRNNDFPVVEHNAWKTDYAANPLIPLWDELSHELKKINLKSGIDEKSVIEELIRTGKKLSKMLAPYVEVPVWPGVPLRLVMRRHKSDPVETDPVETYQKTKNTLKDFQTGLSNAASPKSTRSDTSSQDRKDPFSTHKPLVILVDELDRCRPSHAVEFLEITKHLFDVDNIIFVLGVNLTQLQHAVGALYGSSFNSAKYLRRFFDHTLSLPMSDREKFIDGQLSDTGLGSYIRGGPDDESARGGREGEIALDWLKSYCNASDVDLRDIQQMIRHSGLVLSSLSRNRFRFRLATVLAIIVRSADLDIYRRIINADISDDDAYQALQAISSISSLPHHVEFEAAIIMACRDMIDGCDYEKLMPRLQRHQEQINSSTRSERICELVKIFDNQVVQREEGFGFRHVVSRLEFLSPRHFGVGS